MKKYFIILIILVVVIFIPIVPQKVNDCVSGSGAYLNMISCVQGYEDEYGQAALQTRRIYQSLFEIVAGKLFPLVG